MFFSSIFSVSVHKKMSFISCDCLKNSNFIWSVFLCSVLSLYCPSEITEICACFHPEWTPFNVVLDPPQNLSAINDKICSSFVCRSTAGDNDPLLPHKNFIWNSVLEFDERNCYNISMIRNSNVGHFLRKITWKSLQAVHQCDYP